MDKQADTGTVEVAVIIDTASPKTVEGIRNFIEGNTGWSPVPKRSSKSEKEQCTVLVYEVRVS